ncbi:SgcJ/EcaC family oxidoreductase [Myxococcaceae bacterium GXIMD 01537]
MTTRFRVATLAAVLLSLVLVPPALAKEPAHSGARALNEAALRKLVADQAEAWNRQDAVAWSKDFAPDAEFINIVGTVFNGHADIEKRHAAIFNTLFKGSQTQVTVRKVLFLGGDVAVLDMEHRVTGFSGLPPGIQPTVPGELRTQMRYVLKRANGQWRIVAGQNTDVKPAPAQAPAAAPAKP